MTTSNPLAFTTPLPPLCSRLCAVSAIQRTCPIARTQRKSTVTELRSSAFLPSFAWCVGLKASIGAGRSLKVMCQDHTQKTESEEEHEDEQNRFVHKFDPDSDTVCNSSHVFSNLHLLTNIVTDKIAWSLNCFFLLLTCIPSFYDVGCVWSRPAKRDAVLDGRREKRTRIKRSAGSNCKTRC